MYTTSALFRAAALASLLLQLGCADAEAVAQGPAPVEVAVVTVTPAPVALAQELPGRVEASRSAEIRARAAGIVTERVFTEGADVAAGDVLYRIDAAPMQAAHDAAAAALARAQANLAQSDLRAERYARLVTTNAVSRQEHDDAQAARDVAKADVAAAKAALATARLNLGYTTVTAPIAGRIGRAEVTEGALVGQGEATLLATIQQLDPVYVNLTQSIAEVQAMRRALEKGELASAGDGAVAVTLIRADGSEHPVQGTLLFTDITVDASTGGVALRASVPNPGAQLLPGEFVRARLAQAVVNDAITVPQQAVRRDSAGASVMVVGADEKLAARPIVVGDAVGDAWLVKEGLQPGDRVVVEGLQRARPGAAVHATAWED